MITVVEKCERLEANMPKWEIYKAGQLVCTVTDSKYLQASIAVHSQVEGD